MSDKIFVKGLWIDKKTFDNGEIIKLSVKVEDFCNFLDEHINEKGYVNIDIKTKRENNGYYAELNTYKKKTENNSEENIVRYAEEELGEDLPF